MRVCVSGPARELTEAEKDYIYRSLERELREGDKLVSGGAMGVDAECVWVAYDLGHWVDLIVPETKPWDEGLKVFAQYIRPVPGTYMDRNDALAERGDRLVAFPETIRQVPRSGTWATVRRFEKLEKLVKLYPLDQA